MLDIPCAICYTGMAVKKKPLQEAAMKQDPTAMTLLFDYYGETLSEKQKTCFDLYYSQDYSLAEIAEDVGISRQGVHDSITRAETALRKMEEKTGFIAREQRLQDALAEISRAAAALLDNEDETVKQLAQTISAAAQRIKE